MRGLLYILLAAMVYAVLFYLETYQPETLTKLLIQVDVFGFTHVAEQEKERLGKINELTIPYEEKQVLINHTVFMGASQDMVKFALGEPTKPPAHQIWKEKNVMLTYYIYYLPDDRRPTILVFQDDKLIKAYKGSALDVGN